LNHNKLKREEGGGRERKGEDRRGEGRGRDLEIANCKIPTTISIRPMAWTKINSVEKSAWSWSFSSTVPLYEKINEYR